jgi:hypothetical protein
MVQAVRIGWCCKNNTQYMWVAANVGGLSNCCEALGWSLVMDQC